MNDVAYGFVAPVDIQVALDNSYLVEAFRGESGISEFWMKFPDGQVVGYVKVNVTTSYIHDIQVRAEKLGIGSRLVDLLREVVPNIKSTGTATTAGANLIASKNIKTDDAPRYPVSPMRFVKNWDYMVPLFPGGFDREVRDDVDVPRSFRNDAECNRKFRLGTQLIPAEHLSHGDFIVQHNITISNPSNEDSNIIVFVSKDESLIFPVGSLVEVSNE